jgi:hypothetical protein
MSSSRLERTLGSRVAKVNIVRRVAFRWPLLAVALMALGYGSAAIRGELSYFFYSTVLLAGAICAIGFGSWIFPWLRKIWRSAMGKLVLTWLHAVVVVLALIPAQLLVAEAVELPPQDFEVTVALCAAVLFLPVAWIAIFLVPIAILSMFLFFAFGVLSLLNTMVSSGVWEVLILFLEPNFPTAAYRLRRFVEQGRSKSAELAWKSWGRAFGAFMLVFVVAVAHGQYPSAKAYLKPIVRGVAYLADYQQVPKYPGVDENRRSRVHENGIVSYAEDRGGDIVISVDSVRLNTSKEP